MDLSIIFRVRDDVRIKKAIESIDEDVEVVVVLNRPTNEVRKIIKDMNKMKVVEIYDNNLAKAFNVGIEQSSKNNVLLMDSDCIFIPNTIKKIYSGLKSAPLSKGRVYFLRKTFIGKIVALSREFHVSDIINAYAPSLAFKKTIKEDIGGYFFDERIFWTEDHEFDQRIKRAKLKINYNASAIILHEELSIKSDLKSAYHYGMGYYQGTSKGIVQSSLLYGGGKMIISSLVYDILRLILSPLFFINVWFKKNFLTATYMMIWMIIFTIGYYSQAFFNILNEEKNGRKKKNISFCTSP